MLQPQIVLVWPDYDWCYPDQLEEYSHKSDDYMEITILISSESHDREFDIDEYLEYHKPQDIKKPEPNEYKDDPRNKEPHPNW